MDNLIKNGDYRWQIKLPTNNTSKKLKEITFSGPVKMAIKENETSLNVPDFQDNSQHRLISIDKKNNIRLFSFPANIQRCYVRILGKNLYISNTVMPLFKKGEKIKLDSEVLLRQISNLFWPLDNLFVDIKLLDASSIYRIRQGELVFEDTTVKPTKSNVHLIQDYIVNKFDYYCRGGIPLAIPLSGGIDSRLNLALCYHFAKKNKNQIITYHEYKDKTEYEIAKLVADQLGLPFVCVTRDRFRVEPLKYILSPEFIEFHGGIYRDTLARWFSFMDMMRLSHPDCKIIGMGADAHKGKFYRSINRLPEDAEKILGYQLKDNHIPREKTFFPFISNKLNDEFYSDISKRSLVFNNLPAMIDFVFYHIRTCRQATSRAPFFHLNYRVPFPFYNDYFLSLVFSLPKKYKIDAAIPKNLIKKLNPKLSRIPYASGNAKCFRRQYLNFFKKGINYITKPKDKDRRNEMITWNHPMVMEKINGANSEITSKLENFIKKEAGMKRPNGEIKFECALRVYLFLRQAEEKLGVDFVCK